MLLPAPIGKLLFFLDLPLNLGLLQGPLAFEIELTLHRHILRRLPLLELTVLRRPIDGHIASHPADGATDEHGRRAAAKDGATGPGTQRRTTDRSHTWTATAAFAGANAQGYRGDDDKCTKGQAGVCIQFSHDYLFTSAVTALTISSNERALSLFLSAALNAFIL